MKRNNYDHKLLKKYKDENNVSFLKNYFNDKINGKTRIEGYCKENECLNSFNKIFKQLLKTGAYCDECTSKKSILKNKIIALNKIQEKFIKYCNDNNITLLKDYSNELLNIKNAIIDGKCINLECKNIFSKKLVCLFKSGPYCSICTQNNECIKIKKTCMEKYGVDNANKTDATKDKIKKNLHAKIWC
jgi:hypothetical protein